MKYLLLFFTICLLSTCGSDKKVHERDLQEVLLKKSELEGKSLQALRIIRNEIFARKGYRFKSQDLRDHFSAFDWYKPLHNNPDSLLTDIEKQNVQTILAVETQLKRSVLDISDQLIGKYKEALTSGDQHDSVFVTKLLWTIDQFKGHAADTTLLTIGNIDGLGEADTVKTHIYALDGTIHLQSRWNRNGETLWSDDITDPYLWLGAQELSPDNRHPWVTFAIAVHHGAPALSERKDYPGIDRVTALLMAKWHIENNGLEISEDDYAKYFDQFDGALFTYGDPELRSELLLWYEPKKQFIRYYAP